MLIWTFILLIHCQIFKHALFTQIIFPWFLYDENCALNLNTSAYWLWYLFIIYLTISELMGTKLSRPGIFANYALEFVRQRVGSYAGKWRIDKDSGHMQEKWWQTDWGPLQNDYVPMLEYEVPLQRRAGVLMESVPDLKVTKTLILFLKISSSSHVFNNVGWPWYRT